MKKLSRVLALVMALSLLLLTACGNGGSSAPAAGSTAEPGSTATSEPGSEAGSEPAASGDAVEIDFWTHYSDDIAFTKKKVEDYNTLMEGKVKVNLTHVADDYNNVVMMALRNGEGPDIFADGPLLADFVTQDFLAPLEEYASEEMIARAEPFLAKNNNWLDGHWYSLPFRGYNFRLAWNKDMFTAAGLDPEQPPKSYDELVETAKILTEYGAAQNPQQYGFMLPTGEDWIWWIYGEQMGRVNGENFFDYTTGEFKWEAMRPVMEMYLELQENNCLFPGGTTMQNDPARAQFSAGNVGMILAASWDIGVFNDQFPAEIEWDVTTLPTTDGEVHGYSVLDCGSYLMINNGSDYKPEAMAFYEYLLSEETLVEYYENGYGIPVYPGIAEAATVVPDRPGFSGFATVENDRVYPYEPPIAVEGKGRGEVLNDVMNGAVSLDDAIADLNKRYNDAIQNGIDSGEFVLEDYIVPGSTTMNPQGE